MIIANNPMKQTKRRWVVIFFVDWIYICLMVNYEQESVCVFAGELIFTPSSPSS